MSPRLLAAATATALLVATSTAAAASRPVRIVTPAADASLTSRTVDVRIATRDTAPRLRVTAYGPGGRRRDVSGRFVMRRSGRFTGRLRVGHQLQVGRNSVFAELRGERGTVTGRHFTVTRRAAGSLRIRRAGAGHDRHGPLRVRVRAVGDRLRARLNGRPAGFAFEPRGDGRWRAALTVRDGLDYGRNRLAVTVFRGDRFRRARRTFRVSRARPIADAGPDRRVRAGARIHLDGGGTLPAQHGDLRWHWRIVERPRGSRGRLTGAAGPRPRLRTDRNGTYRIRLAAAHTRRGRAAAAQAAPGSSDTIAVAATPPPAPAGVPVQTLATQDGQVGILAAGVFSPMPTGAAVQLVEVDRTTLAVTSLGYAAGDEPALLAEVQRLKALGGGTLAILSGGGRGPYAAPQPVQQAIEAIGGLVDDYGDAPIGDLGELTAGNGGWSVIGVPGGAAGEAYQLIGLQQSAGAPAGAMSGQLRQASDGLEYVFSWAPEYLTYDTSAAQTATANTIAVGDATYPSSTLPFEDGRDARVGYQLVWLDADTLKVRANATFDADPASSYSYGISDLHGMNGLLVQLRAILADPKPGLILLNTIGSVPTLYYNGVKNRSDGNDARGEIAARITSLIEQFGANRWAFILQGSGLPGPGTPGGYSLVGLTGLRYLKGPNAGAELSTRLTAGGSARLAGVLERSRQGVLTAGTSGTLDPAGAASAVQPALGRILAQPPQRYQPFADPAQAAAEQYIGRRLGLDTSDATYGIRANYWGTTSEQWDILQGDLRDPDTVPPCTDSPCAGGFAAVRDTLVAEFGDVATVRGYFTDTSLDGLADILSTVFTMSGGSGLEQIATDIRSAYETTRSDGSTGPDALGILGGSLGIVAGLGEFIPEVGQEIAAAATVTAGVTEIIGATTETDDQHAAFDPYGFHTTMTEIQTDLYDAYQNALGSLARTADLLVSDPGRMRAAVGLITLDAADGGWQLSADGAIQLKARLTRTLRQYMWLTIGQPVLATYECATEDIAGVRSHNADAVMAANVNFPRLKSPDDRRYHEWWNLYPTSIVLGDRNAGTGWPDVASKTITGDLFGAPDLKNYPPRSAAVGFQREYLFDRARAKYGTDNRPHFDYDIEPASPGLVHKTMNMSGKEEDSSGLSHRDNFSMYTPSCGNGQKLRWSDPDPKAPDALDPTQPPEGDPGGAQFDVPFNPYKNP